MGPKESSNLETGKLYLVIGDGHYRPISTNSDITIDCKRQYEEKCDSIPYLTYEESSMSFEIEFNGIFPGTEDWRYNGYFKEVCK